MSPSRRDLLKYATAGAFLKALPAADVSGAMRTLEAPISPAVELDPGAFAEHTFSTMFEGDDTWTSAIAPVEYAAFSQSLNRLRDLVPALESDPGSPIWRAYSAFENDFLHLINVSHARGLRQGAAFEHLRQSLINEHTHCRACWGSSVLDGQPCPGCNGAGYVGLASVGLSAKGAQR